MWIVLASKSCWVKYVRLYLSGPLKIGYFVNITKKYSEILLVREIQQRIKGCLSESGNKSIKKEVITDIEKTANRIINDANEVLNLTKQLKKKQMKKRDKNGKSYNASKKH